MMVDVTLRDRSFKRVSRKRCCNSGDMTWRDRKLQHVVTWSLLNLGIEHFKLTIFLAGKLWSSKDFKLFDSRYWYPVMQRCTSAKLSFNHLSEASFLKRSLSSLWPMETYWSSIFDIIKPWWDDNKHFKTFMPLWFIWIFALLLLYAEIWSSLSFRAFKDSIKALLSEILIILIDNFRTSSFLHLSLRSWRCPRLIKDTGW